MRFSFILIALSMLVWAVAASAPATVHGGQKSKAVTGEGTDATAPDAVPAVVAPDATPDATPELSPDIVNGGQQLAAPAGERTAAEEKADSVLNCVTACTTVECQNGCISTGYGVDLTGPVPSGNSTTPTASATSTSAVATATITVTGTTTAATTAAPAPTVAHAGASALSIQLAGSAVAIVLASLFASI
ncbi:hypothetical protein BGZ76_010349 [Entomortierella beljakovae]|nr:hypothetical protein BGZ76_010349 [Entomortierella beljakovae]